MTQETTTPFKIQQLNEEEAKTVAELIAKLTHLIILPLPNDDHDFTPDLARKAIIELLGYIGEARSWLIKLVGANVTIGSKPPERLQ